MTDCIFCKIINGELPSAKVFENDDVLAFMDISQITKGHTLVIPKVHTETIFDMSEETASTLFKVVPEIANAIKTALNCKGLNILNNNGSQAGQEVFHYHLHLIPRYDETDGLKVQFTRQMDDYTQEDLQNIASIIREHIQA